MEETTIAFNEIVGEIVRTQFLDVGVIQARGIIFSGVGIDILDASWHSEILEKEKTRQPGSYMSESSAECM